MKKLLITIAIVALLAGIGRGYIANAAEAVPTDNELALQAQVLSERYDKLQAQLQVTRAEYVSVKAEIDKRAVAKKAEPKEKK